MAMLSIGNVTIKSPLVLAPMAGISDLPYRLINRSLGCKFAFTEMISAAGLVYNSKNTLKMMSVHEADRPLGVQLLGNDPEMLKRALDIVSGYPFDTIDFNSACPVKKVAGKGKGAGLLREPEKLQNLLKVIVESTDLPVTVKIRSGWDDSAVNAVDVALRAQDAGVSALVIHGRTKVQAYRGTVDYAIIGKVKDALAIPVIASGDALTPMLIRKLFLETGCDAVAVARGALGNPWIFRETTELLEKGTQPQGPDVNEIVHTMKEHLRWNVAFDGERIGVVRFRKYFAWYGRGLAVKELKRRAFQAVSYDEMLGLIDKIRTVPAPGDVSHIRETAVKHSHLQG